MTDMTSNESKPKSLKGPLEYGPLIIFFLLYFYLRKTMEDPSQAIYPAALVFTVLAVIALIISRIRLKEWSLLLVFSTGVIAATTGLSYVFDDPRFIYMKPTIVMAAIGLAVLGGVVFKKNIIKLIMGEAFELTEKAWNTLAIRWGLFYIAMAILNECVWRNFDEPTWVKFKLLGFMPLTLIFAFTQIPFVMKNGKIKGHDTSES